MIGSVRVTMWAMAPVQILGTLAARASSAGWPGRHSARIRQRCLPLASTPPGSVEIRKRPGGCNPASRSSCWQFRAMPQQPLRIQSWPAQRLRSIRDGNPVFPYRPAQPLVLHPTVPHQ